MFTVGRVVVAGLVCVPHERLLRLKDILRELLLFVLRDVRLLAP